MASGSIVSDHPLDGLPAASGRPRSPGFDTASPDAVPAEDLVRLAEALESMLDKLVADVLLRLRQTPSGAARRLLKADPRLEGVVSEALRVQLRAFRSGTASDRCPELQRAAEAAVVQIPESDVLRGAFRLCRLSVWESWFELVESYPRLDDSSRRLLLLRGSEFFLGCADLLGDHVASSLPGAASGFAGGTGEQRRLRAVRGVLDDDPTAPDLDDYDLSRHHLGLISWGTEARPAVTALATALGRPFLCVAPVADGGSCWAWISGHRPLEPREEHLIASFRPQQGSLAIGIEAPGREGFRSTHRQAIRARGFGHGPDPQLIRYQEVALDALATENEPDARAFVAHELRGLEDDSPTSQRLRDTLSAYFACEYNAASAAARLGVHQQTVANRLRAAEERLGQPSIGARRVELELALRLRPLLTPAEG